MHVRRYHTAEDSARTSVWRYYVTLGSQHVRDVEVFSEGGERYRWKIAGEPESDDVYATREEALAAAVQHAQRQIEEG